jgi:Holliday junction DNA helicase RuvA
LRRKVPKFALMAAREEPATAEVETDVVSEAFEVLRKLGHGESDARRLVDGVLAQKKKFKDVQEVLQAIYDKSQG